MYMTCAYAGTKTGKSADEIQRLKDFEKDGTKSYLYSKRCEEETETLSKTADRTLHNKLHKTEKKAEKTLKM